MLRAMTYTKIVATLGPATEDAKQTQELVAAGVDVVRLNLSHGTLAMHETMVSNARRAATASNRALGVLADLQGPKIRLGSLAGGPVQLWPGDEFVVTTLDVPGNTHEVSTNYPGLPDDVRVGDHLLVDDGKIALQVVRVADARVTTRVVNGGRLSDHKGMNLPNVTLNLPSLTDKDKADLTWALRLGVDAVALSFVRSPEDADAVRQMMDAVGVRRPVIAKIERPEAVDRLESILDAFDGLMIARGDLGIELPLEAVPAVQKRAIELAREAAKPVIVATQMLESMVGGPRPTRAEVSDVANAVLDGADAVMLSAETSIGRYPVEAVQMMHRIVTASEAPEARLPNGLAPDSTNQRATASDALAAAATTIGEAIGAAALVAFTVSGATARRLAQHRPRLPLLVFTPTEEVRNQLSLIWGVEAFRAHDVQSTDALVASIDASLIRHGRARVGDPIVLVTGSRLAGPATTSGVFVHHVGERLPQDSPREADRN
jgi:pyruvate kinase